ncbi:MAG TPA: isochorismatase family protein, partial [Gemmatimonadaceae bacterium]|nr:isochorismatase family protein [Gemmatimonadaceae bacterium]
NVNSAFIGTDLESYLRAKGIQSLVVVGLTTAHCLSTSVRMAANLGFDVTVVADATATHARRAVDGTTYSPELIHNVELAALKDEFATIRNTRELLAEVDESLPARTV